MSTPPSLSLSETVGKHKRPISFSGMNVNQVKQHLAIQVAEKERLLEKFSSSQIARNALIKQADAIHREILHLNQQYNPQDKLPIEIQSKLEDLSNEFQYLKNSKVSYILLKKN